MRREFIPHHLPVLHYKSNALQFGNIGSDDWQLTFGLVMAHEERISASENASSMGRAKLFEYVLRSATNLAAPLIRIGP